MKKKIVVTITITILIIFISPFAINCLITNGLFGWKPFKSEFNNLQWFSFYSSFIPGALAFIGTMLAVSLAFYQNNKLQELEKRNLALKFLPIIRVINMTTQIIFFLEYTDNKYYRDILKNLDESTKNVIERIRKAYSTDIKNQSISVRNKISSIDNIDSNFESMLFQDTIHMDEGLYNDIKNVYDLKKIKKGLEKYKSFENRKKISRRISRNNIEISVLDNKLNNKMPFSCLKLVLSLQNISDVDIKSIFIKDIYIKTLEQDNIFIVNDLFDINIPHVPQIAENKGGASVHITLELLSNDFVAYKNNIEITVEILSMIRTVHDLSYNCNFSIGANIGSPSSMSYASLFPE